LPKPWRGPPLGEKNGEHSLYKVIFPNNSDIWICQSHKKVKMSLINTLQDGNVQYGLLAASAVGLAYWLYKLAYGTDIGFIKGIPEIPGSIPFYGDLKTLGGDHATAFEEFGVKNNWPVLQAKLGNRRILVVNSFDAAQEWMVKNATATISRPWFYTFHGLLSITQGNPNKKLWH